jgi:hypothetical protein
MLASAAADPGWKEKVPSVHPSIRNRAFSLHRAGARIDRTALHQLHLAALGPAAQGHPARPPRQGERLEQVRQGELGQRALDLL